MLTKLKFFRPNESTRTILTAAFIDLMVRVSIIVFRSTVVIKLTPDDHLYDAMQLFDIKDIKEIPVVDSHKSPWVLGMLKRRDVIAVYNHEVLKRGISE